LVEGSGDAAQGRALAAQPPDFRQCGLLGRMRFQMQPVV
jgi:hypothetical protein